MRKRTRQVWFVVFPESELLDLSGPWSVLGYVNEVAQRALYETHLFTPSGGSVRTRHGLVLAGTQSITDARGAPDTLVISGGARSNGRSTPEQRFAAWLREHHRRVSRIVSVCTGAFALGEAGLLDGRRATTHWQFRAELRERFPRARVEHDDIFLRDGRIWTSAGITAGIDLMLALVEEDHGHTMAMTVAKGLVLFLRRSGQQAQFSMMLERQGREATHMRGFSALVLEHLDERLPVERLAQLTGMATRTLSRWCERELGERPAELVRRLRLEEARRLLEQTGLPLKAIAAQTGIGDSSTLWRVFMRSLGVTPAQYRAAFAVKQSVRARSSH